MANLLILFVLVFSVMDFQKLLETVFLGNTVEQYGIALIVLLGIIFVLYLIKVIVVARLRYLAKRTKNTLDDSVVDSIYSIKFPFYVSLALFFSSKLLYVEQIIQDAIYFILLFFVVFYGAKIVQIIIAYFINHAAEKKAEEEGGDAVVDRGFVRLMGQIASIVIWIIAILFFLSNLGVDVTTFIASLGIGGIAIAFALQGVLADLFASFAIHFDKPFMEGDYIVVGGDSGTVQRIGLKSTRIKTLQGQELVISNKELTEARINNFKKLQKRRVVFVLGVTYETPNAKLKKIPGIIATALKSIKYAEFDRCHFKSFGDFSLNFEIVYYVDKGDYARYVEIENELNMRIKAAFEKAKIDFAYPTQQLYLKKN